MSATINDFKLAESNKYRIGDKGSEWDLYVGLYQNYTNYYYVIFDKDETDYAIISCVVSPSTANALEEAIHKAIVKPYTLGILQDVYDNLQSGFYGSMFKIQEYEK